MTPIKFSVTEFFKEILEKPALLHDSYKAFHNYSVCNQYLAAIQLPKIEPIATYKQWQAMGRQVQKGAKAIALRMPVTVKDKDDDTKTNSFFVFKKNWFGLSSTQGDEYVSPVLPGWDKEKALATLGITEIPFEKINGNCMGYARPDLMQVSVSPLAYDYLKTLFHELAHCLLHKNSDRHDNDNIPMSVQEFEAEATAYLVAGALGTGSLIYSRGYLQHWLGHSGLDAIKEANMKRALSAADKILKAGKVA